MYTIVLSPFDSRVIYFLFLDYSNTSNQNSNNNCLPYLRQVVIIYVSSFVSIHVFTSFRNNILAYYILDTVSRRALPMLCDI